jgi:hypothetical protein
MATLYSAIHAINVAAAVDGGVVHDNFKLMNNLIDGSAEYWKDNPPTSTLGGVGIVAMDTWWGILAWVLLHDEPGAIFGILVAAAFGSGISNFILGGI